jgi:hypothetical protein
MEEIKKKNDENWKAEVEKENEALKQDKGFIPPEPDFSFFVTTLSIQASIALGIIPDPANNKTTVDPQHAKFLIDTLTMIQEKTKGNLNEGEEKLLENLLYELRLQYIEKSKVNTPGTGGKEV